MASSSYGLLSPANSATSNSTSGIHLGSVLPPSRSHPLKPGSAKESALINFLDDKILRVTRRYAKKFSNSDKDNDDTKGYETFDQVVEDLNSIFEVTWISGTPTLQVPYLLTIAGLFCSYMQAFPFSTDMFTFVKRLDEAFAALLRTPSDEAKNNSRFAVSITDRVRIKSLAEETRVIAVDIASESGISTDPYVSEDDEDDEETESAENELSPASMKLSRIYIKTIEILGDSLV